MPRNAFKEFASIFGVRVFPACSGALVQVPACGAPFQKPLQAHPCALLSGHPWPTTFLERCPTSRNSNFGFTADRIIGCWKPRPLYEARLGGKAFQNR